MKHMIRLLLLLLVNVSVNAQKIPDFKSLRYNEDYRFLKHDSIQHWYTKLKYKPLSENKNSFISIGGEIRYQYFNFKNEDWGDAPEDKNGYILTRFLAHAAIHTGNHFRTFIQLQSSLASDRNSPSPLEENSLDFHQLFFDINFPIKKEHKLVFRLGRQEMTYGSQRLISVRDGPNNRQAFDAAKLLYSGKGIQIDALYAHHVPSNPGIFDDRFNKQTILWGTYTVLNKRPILQNIDLYYWGVWKKTALYDEGSGREIRHSIGTRVWDQQQNYRYDLEGLYQFGKFGDKTIQAWTLSANCGYTVDKLRLKPELGLKAELISGDRIQGDNYLQTFNPLFPKGNYFGLAALIGPSNLIDIHPSLSLKLKNTLSISIDYDVFWRYSTEDGIYTPGVTLIYSANNNPHRFIGHQYSSDLSYAPNPFLFFKAEFTWFRPGAFIKYSGAGKDILFTAITSQLKF